MKKVRYLISLLLVLTLILCACGNTADKTSKEENVITGEENRTDNEGTEENNVEKLKPGILLCGEMHSDQTCIDNELKRWGEFYAKGARHLFMEQTYALIGYINEWMHVDSDDILEEVFADLTGTAACSPQMMDFFRRIKKDYPETIFHSTDIGHQYASTGARYVKKLEDEGKKDTEEYKRAVENNESGEKFYAIGNYETIESANFREQKMVEYFIKEYEALSDEFVMGIYGWGHMEIESTHCYCGSDPQLVNQLIDKYGDLVQVEGMTWIDPVSTEKVVINGKEYDAEYYGEFDISAYGLDIEKYRIWKIDNAYEDLKNSPSYDDYFYVCDCPFKVQDNEIYLIEYIYFGGEIERIAYKSDIVDYDGSPALHGISVE